MKRLLLALVIACIPFSLEALTDYAGKALWIENDMMYTLDTPQSEISIPYGTWIPHQGKEAITQRQFFQIAGREDLASQAFRMERVTDICAWGGATSLVIGFVLLALFPDNKAASVTAMTLMGGGLLGSVAALVSDRQRKVTLSIPLALETAKTYNKTLH